ncbi:unnamed protein product [Euphydryas editha]|uniref:Uncharacterized protein n=1 Tax=Euphydryas editha TaxID=104508 RepID=A0AAU9U3L1_EUPED|nr:unnamed protein product [Euphydryas editha]
MHLLAATVPNLRNIYITRHIPTVFKTVRSEAGSRTAQETALFCHFGFDRSEQSVSHGRDTSRVGFAFGVTFRACFSVKIGMSRSYVRRENKKVCNGRAERSAGCEWHMPLDTRARARGAAPRDVTRRAPSRCCRVVGSSMDRHRSTARQSTHSPLLFN